MKLAKIVSRAFAVFLISIVVLQASNALIGDEHETSDPGLKPVEADPHEFMEYAFEPFFKQLKQSLKEAPADRKAWVPVKANSLILAENGNLLMLRAPKEGSRKWNEKSAALREQGTLVYQAAKKRDYKLTKKNYVQMVAKCNQCHTQFADGEHIQKP